MEWDNLPADLLYRVLEYLADHELLLRAMASSKLWRTVALSHMEDLSLSVDAHETSTWDNTSRTWAHGRLIACASRMGKWSSLKTLRLHENIYDCTEPQVRAYVTHIRSAFGKDGGFSTISTLDIDAVRLSGSLAYIFERLPQLTAFRGSDGMTRTNFFGNACAALAAPSLCGRIQKLQLDGIERFTTPVQVAAAMRSLSKLTALDTLVTCAPIPLSGLPGLRLLQLSENSENMFAPIIDDTYLAGCLEGHASLETLCLDGTWHVTGATMRSASLTALSLHGCLARHFENGGRGGGLSSAGLIAMAGSLPALRKFAFSSPHYLRVDPHVHDTTTKPFTSQDVIDFIASCPALTELHLDEIFAHFSDGFAPKLIPYSLKQLKAVEASCVQLEILLVVMDPPCRLLDSYEEDDDEPGCHCLHDLVVFHSSTLPRLYNALMICEEEDLVYSEATMGMVGWANCQERVAPPKGNLRFDQMPGYQ